MVIAKEKIEYFALIAEIVGGLGVIISVVYLALQVGDGNRELRSQNHLNALTLVQRPMEMLIADADLAAIYVTGKNSDQELSGPEAQRLQYFGFLQLNGWEFTFYQNADGTIPQELWLGLDAWMRDEARNNVSFRNTWKEMEHAFADPFRSYVREIILPSEKSLRKE